MIRAAFLLPLLALAACDGGDAEPQEPAGEALPQQSAPDFPPPPAQPSAEQMALLDSRDCRMVAQAYLDAIAGSDFDFAARIWDDPVIDAARLAARFAEYEAPAVEIADIQEEGAAGSLYCTVTGALSDIADPAHEPQSGELVLRRVNDVPGATEQQLRWTLRSSTFIEPMERSTRGGPA